MVALKLLPQNDSKGRPLWRLLEEYRYELGPGSVVTVPAGYVTNLGSIPRFYSWIISPGEMREASIVHDYMCNEKFTDGPGEHYSGYSRWLADAVLYEALQRQGFRWPTRFSIFSAVRIWAWISMNNRWSQRPVMSLQVRDDPSAPPKGEDVE